MAVITSPISPSYSLGRGGWRDLDWLLLFLVIALSIWGCATIVSATRPGESTTAARAVSGVASPASSTTSTSSAPISREHLPDAVKQGVWVCVGITAMLLL